MKSSVLKLGLTLEPEQVQKLTALQACFADACNALVPLVREHHCWNRVTLHHMGYRYLRERFPELGSQMVCNAIYSVCRTCRHIFQSPSSPYFRGRRSDEPLPEINFLPTSPVFFDRHTLSVREGVFSMFTLEGRMRFFLLLSSEDELRFQSEKLREIVLLKKKEGFSLSISFGGDLMVLENEMPEYSLVVSDFSCDNYLSQPESEVSKSLESYIPR